MLLSKCRWQTCLCLKAGSFKIMNRFLKWPLIMSNEQKRSWMGDSWSKWKCSNNIDLSECRNTKVWPAIFQIGRHVEYTQHKLCWMSVPSANQCNFCTFWFWIKHHLFVHTVFFQTQVERQWEIPLNKLERVCLVSVNRLLQSSLEFLMNSKCDKIQLRDLWQCYTVTVHSDLHLTRVKNQLNTKIFFLINSAIISTHF